MLQRKCFLLSVKLNDREKSTYDTLKKYIESSLGINLDKPDHLQKVIADYSDSFGTDSSMIDSLDSQNDEDEEDDQDYDIRYYVRRKQKNHQIIEEENKDDFSKATKELQIGGKT